VSVGSAGFRPTIVQVVVVLNTVALYYIYTFITNNQPPASRAAPHNTPIAGTRSHSVTATDFAQTGDPTFRRFNFTEFLRMAPCGNVEERLAATTVRYPGLLPCRWRLQVSPQH
jgi:hypothetical protein